MKKMIKKTVSFLICLFLCIGVIGCNSKPDSQIENDAEIQVQEDNTELIETETIATTENEVEEIEEKINPDTLKEHKYFTADGKSDGYEIYDEKGNIIEENHGLQQKYIIEYGEDGKIEKISEPGRISSWCFPEYDDKGNIIKKVWIREDKHICEKEEYVYDEKNRLIKAVEVTGANMTENGIFYSGSVYDKGLIYTYEYEYDEEGNLINEKRICEDTDGSKRNKTTDYVKEYSDFDDNGNPSKCLETSIYEEDINNYSFEYTYDENNNCIEEKWYSNGEYIGKYVREYNERGLITYLTVYYENDEQGGYETFEYWG